MFRDAHMHSNGKYPDNSTATFELKRPDISVSPDSLDFGTIKVGKGLSKTLKISNNGTGNLEITISVMEETGSNIQGSSNVTIKPQKIYNLKSHI